MAIYLALDKKQQSTSGLIPLKRGDDWKLVGKVVEKYASYQADLDLTGISGATAFFSADPVVALPGNVLSVIPSVVDAMCGKVEIDVPASSTAQVAIAEDGIGCYLTLQLPQRGLITAPMELPILSISDRGFDLP